MKTVRSALTYSPYHRMWCMAIVTSPRGDGIEMRWGAKKVRKFIQRACKELS